MVFFLTTVALKDYNFYFQLLSANIVRNIKYLFCETLKKNLILSLNISYPQGRGYYSLSALFCHSHHAKFFKGCYFLPPVMSPQHLHTVAKTTAENCVSVVRDIFSLGSPSWPHTCNPLSLFQMLPFKGICHHTWLRDILKTFRKAFVQMFMDEMIVEI